jgi:hypothetical protein
VANILFTVSLSKKFDSKQLASFSVHPGSKFPVAWEKFWFDRVLDISTGLQKHFQDPVVFKEIVEYVEAKIGGKNIQLSYPTSPL